MNILGAQLETGYKKIRERFFAKRNVPDSCQDAILKAEVWMALWQADDLHALDIGDVDIVVRQCEVWLTGQVTDLQQCKLAEYLVNGINGVRRIHNYLTVEPG